MVIKFPLNMADGAQVRSIEELREHFDLKTVLDYYSSGRLVDWLRSRYYDEEADAVSALNSSSADFKKGLYQALGVSYSEEEASSANLDNISQKSERREMLRRYTADDTVLAAADRVALNQDELLELLEKGEKEIYLFGGEFVIPANFENVTYIGANDPKIELSKDISSKNIVFKNIDMKIKTLEDILDLKNLDLENYDPKVLNPEMIYVIRKEAENGNPIAQHIYGRYCLYGDGSVVGKKEAIKWYIKAAEQNFPDAQYELSFCYKWGRGVEIDEEKANEWRSAAIENYRRLAKQGDAKAQYGLANCISDGGFWDFYSPGEATEWYHKAAEQGHIKAMICLAHHYASGIGVQVNKQEAEKLCRKIEEKAEQGDMNFLCEIAEHCTSKGFKEESIKLYRRAADKGHVKAMIKLLKHYKEPDTFVRSRSDFDQNYYQQETEKWSNKIVEAVGRGDADFLCETASILEDEWLKEEAVKVYKKGAEQGYSSAQLNLAKCYYHGDGVDKDDEEAEKWYSEKAVEWFRKAAEKGNAEAQYYLGECYFNGEGIGENEKEGIKWYTKSAEQNNTDAMMQLVYYYFDEESVEQSNDEAIKWLQKAAKQGSVGAMLQLSGCYFNGEVVEQNSNEAIKWLKRAAESPVDEVPLFGGSPVDAMLQLVERYEYGKGIEADKQEVRKWRTKLERIAEQKDANIIIHLGELYYKNEDYDEAVKIFRKAEEQDKYFAPYYLGLCYFEGNGVEKNTDIALSYINKAAKNFNFQAQNWLKQHGYEEPDPFEESNQIMAELKQSIEDSKEQEDEFEQTLTELKTVVLEELRKAAEKGNAEAQYNLGVFYYIGKYVEENVEEAVKWFRKSAEQGYAEAQYNLGVCYYNGEGVEEDIEEAVKWFRKAAEQDDENAQEVLQKIGYEL